MMNENMRWLTYLKESVKGGGVFGVSPLCSLPIQKRLLRPRS
jgi:hypothetical protein